MSGDKINITMLFPIPASEPLKYDILHMSSSLIYSLWHNTHFTTSFQLRKRREKEMQAEVHTREHMVPPGV